MASVLAKEKLLDLFRQLPKESFELMFRNIRIREQLESIWRFYSVSGKLKYSEEFDRIFDEIFRLFFRPLEIFVQSGNIIRQMLPDRTIIGLLEVESQLIDTFNEFIRSWFQHLKLMSEITTGYVLPETSKSLLEDFVEAWNEHLRKYYRIKVPVEDRILEEYPFILPKEASEFLFRSLESWDKFKDEFYKFKEMLNKTYRKAVLNFIEEANKKKIEDFSVFIQTFADLVAKEFDGLMNSDEYLKTQGEMLGSMMDHAYYARRFMETVLEFSPLNPFATISQIDEAYKRILDLKRKIRELEKRVEELERRCK